MAALVERHGARLLVIVGERPERPATCPKCACERTSGPGCPRCGLAVTRMDAYRATRDAQVPADVRAAWEHASARWSEPRAHEDLLAVARRHECCAWLAAQYRDRARTGDAVAEGQLVRLRRALEATLTVEAIARSGTASAPASYRGLKLVAAMLVLIIAATWGYACMQSDRPAAPASGRR